MDCDKGYNDGNACCSRRGLESGIQLRLCGCLCHGSEPKNKHLKAMKEEKARLELQIRSMEAQLVERDRADERQLLPRRLWFFGIDSSIELAGYSSASIVGSPQLDCRPVSVYIPPHLNFMVNDIRVGNSSQPLSATPVHSSSFGRSYRNILSMDNMRVAMTILINVTNLLPDNQRFMATIWCERPNEELPYYELPYYELKASTKDIPNIHYLYRNGDEDIPPQITDRNGQVVLGVCKRCGKSEGELIGPCEIGIG